MAPFLKSAHIYLKPILVQRKTPLCIYIPFGSPYRDRARLANCVCVIEVRTHVVNAFVSSTKVLSPARNVFVSNASVRLQHKTRWFAVWYIPLLAINAFVCQENTVGPNQRQFFNDRFASVSFNCNTVFNFSDIFSLYHSGLVSRDRKYWWAWQFFRPRARMA